MGSSDEINLDLCLAQAVNPLDLEINEEAISQLGHLMKDNKETIGFVLRFFGHKIQSPLELEALKALNVIQALVKRSDKKFIEEVGKFRFLNEMIKVVSPKYLAQRSPDRVKKKVIELLYLWSIELKHEPKIFEAYQMLKRQGISTSDPTYMLPEVKPIPPPPPRPKDEIWDNEENALMLKRLIQSGQPEDRIAANKLIKMLAHQADKKTEIKARCQSELELARNNGRLFGEVLANFTSPEDENFTEKELLDELYDSCKKLRPKLFKLAGELPETEPLFEELLKVNDELTKVINEYDVKMHLVSQPNANGHKPSESNLLLDNSPIRYTSQPSSSFLSTNNNLVDISSPTMEASSSSNDIISSTSVSMMTSSNSISMNDSHIGDVSLLSDHETIKDETGPSSSLTTSTSILNNENVSSLFEMFPKNEAQSVVNAQVNYLKDILVPCMPKPPNSSISTTDLLSSSSTPTTATNDLSTNKSPKRTSCLDELENLMRITLNAGPKPENSGDANIPLNSLRTMLNIPMVDKQLTPNQMNSVSNSTNESVNK